MLQILGMAGCLGSLAKYGMDMDSRAKKAVDKKAEDVMNDMVDMAAWRSGEMAGSIDIEPDTDTDHRYVVRVGPSDDLKSGVPHLPYSILVECGSGRGAAQPFVRPAAEQNKPLKI